jgi:hypothetical protein
MPHRIAIRSSLFAALSAFGLAALAQPLMEGFLCCNMRSDGSWISDINYIGSGKQIVPAGTPIKVTGYGRHRVLIEFDGKKQALGNDYSRDLKLEDFAKRYILATDPVARLETYPPKVREAIKVMRITRGMTREQVLMAVGYPITSYNPDIEAPLWRYWISRSGEYQVFWGDNGRVDKVFGAPEIRAQIVLE